MVIVLVMMAGPCRFGGWWLDQPACPVPGGCRAAGCPCGGLGPIGPELEMTADVALHLQADDTELTRRLQTVH